MRNRNVSTMNYLRKKKEEFFRESKKFFSQQIYNVISQIQLLYICVALLASIDIVVAFIMGNEMWYFHILSIIQIILSLLVTGAVQYWPLKYGNINLIGCTIVHSVWAVQQSIIQTQTAPDKSSSYEQTYYQGERRESLGYMIGLLCFLMISNANNLTIKCILLAFNITMFCAFNNMPLYYIHYIILIFFCICYHLYCDENGKENLIRQVEWMFELKNLLPNSILVVQYDRKKKDLDLHMSNEKARHLFNLNEQNGSGFIDFCQHVTIQKKIKEEINDTLFYLEQSNHKSNKSGGGFHNSLHESRNPHSQYKEKEIDLSKKTNLHQFLIQRFQQLDEELMQKEMQRQTSLQSNDKKSTKTNLAAAFANNPNLNGQNVTEFTNKIGGQQASKSFFGQSKTLINMMTSQRSQKKLMLPLHPSARYKDFSKKFEEYKCVYHRQSQLLHQQQSPQLRDNTIKLNIEEDISDIKFSMKLCVYPCIDDYFVVMTLDESNIAEKFLAQSRQSFFYEEFCKQSLLKSTNQVVQLVQEIKQIMTKSSVITELDLGRFISSNLYLAESGLSNNLKPFSNNSNQNSNNNIPAPTQTTQATAGNGAVGSQFTNPTSNTQKGIYCIPKRQLDHALQTGILASTVISNYVNYFALRYKKRAQIDEKPFSIIKVIKNIQRIFQKELDQKNIQVLINSQESYFSNPASNINVTSNLNNHVSSDIRVIINNNYANSNNHNTSIINVNNLNNNSQMNNNLTGSNQYQNMSFSQVSTSVINHLSNSKEVINPTQPPANNHNPNISLVTRDNLVTQQNNVTNPGGNYIINQPQTRQCDEISNDEAKLQHLIFNLFQNAVENTPHHGTIAILIQRDQLLENCLKIRIRNKCHQNFYFPFLDLDDDSINLGWKQMLQEYDSSGKFYFGIRMAAKLSQLIGPYNSLKFYDINNTELQAEFLITDYSYERNVAQFNQNSSTYKSYDGSSSFIASERQSSEVKPRQKLPRFRCNSLSSYRVRLDSMDSFDKWIKIQNLEAQKGSNTLKIRNQLKYKN